MQKRSIRSNHKAMTDSLNLYWEIEHHLLNDDHPSTYLNGIYNNPLFQQYPFDMLYKLKQTNQSPKHHPEGNVWNHTLLVVDESAKVKSESKNQKVFLWASLLHDIGKVPTTKKRKGRITSYNHDQVGAMLATDFLSQFTHEHEFIQKVCELIRYHMHILFVVNSLNLADIEGMKRHTDIYEVALLGMCDRMGRLNSNPKREKENIQKFLQVCTSATPN